MVFKSINNHDLIKEITDKPRSLFFNNFLMQYQSDIESFVPYRNGGYIFSHSEIKTIIAGLRNFLEQVSDEEIKSHNLEISNPTRDNSKPKSIKKSTKPGYIYFIASGNGMYKIGRTKNLENRLADYRRLPIETEILHSIRVINMEKAEKFFLNMFAEYNIKGEWFRLDNNRDLQRIINGEYPPEIIKLLEA